MNPAALFEYACRTPYFRPAVKTLDLALKVGIVLGTSALVSNCLEEGRITQIAPFAFCGALGIAALKASEIFSKKTPQKQAAHTIHRPNNPKLAQLHRSLGDLTLVETALYGDSPLERSIKDLRGEIETLESSLISQFKDLSDAKQLEPFEIALYQKLLRKRAVDAENVKVLTPKEVEQALSTQEFRAQEAQLERITYESFEVLKCKGTQLTAEKPWPDESSFYFKNHTSNICGYNVRVCEAKGKKKNMEDVHLVTTIKICEYEIPLFGIFDGHGNSNDAAAYVRDNLSKVLFNKLDLALTLIDSSTLTDTIIYNALTSALVTLHNEYEGLAGTTVNIGIIVDDFLYTANIGDSRSIFVTKDGNVISLSQDAVLTDPRHRKIIEDKGGTIDSLSTLRISKYLAMGSALGDHRCRGVNPTVDITKIHLSEGVYLNASDGLWSSMTSDQASKHLDKPIEDLVFSAWAFADNGDDVSAMIIEIPGKKE